MSWFILALKKYFQFSGRSQRKEFWYFLLFSIIFGVLIEFLQSDALSLLFSLAILIPGIALTVRRLHDIGRTGWWALLGIIPILGLIILVMACFDGEPEENQYGLNPKLEPSL